MMPAALCLALCLAPGRAGATCIETCAFYPLFDDCRTPVLGGTWPAELPLAFGVKCGGCCSPPGGPMSCNFTEVPDAGAMTVAPYEAASGQDGPPVKGKFKKTEKTCSDFPVFEFSGKLEPGTYVLTAGDRVSLHIVDTGGNPDSMERMPLEDLLAPPVPADASTDTGTAGAGTADAAEVEPPGAPAEEPRKTREGGCASCTLSMKDGNAPTRTPALFLLVVLGTLLLRTTGRPKR